MLCFSAVAVAETETETATQTTGTFSGSQTLLRFAMEPSPVAETGYRQGNGTAYIEVQGTYLAVHFEAEGMSSSVHLSLVLLANGSSRSAANMTTSYDGEVEAEAAVYLAPGAYSIGLQVIDTSSFSSPTVVQVSSPQTQPLSVVQGTTTTTNSESSQSVSTIQGGETEDDGIRTAIQDKFIPAVVEVGDSGSSIIVNDRNFSVSVGGYQQDGYLVSIYAANVAGPRVLLVNLTSAQARSLFSAPISITLDGSRVQQAGSLSEILGATTADPPRFIVVSSPSSLKLLISIPHFSYHTIAIVPIIVQLGGTLLLDLPVLLFAVAAISVVILAVHSMRIRAPSEATRTPLR